ncbi:MAG: hypothetical protein U0667_13455 [Chloroflexota bacterium]
MADGPGPDRWTAIDERLEALLGVDDPVLVERSRTAMRRAARHLGVAARGTAARDRGADGGRASDLEIGTLVATAPSAWDARCRTGAS